MSEWKNYGDINFIEYGGCLVKEDEYPDCFHVLSLRTDIYDYEGECEEPVIVAKCYVDLSDWLKPEDEERKEVNSFCGYDKDYIPQTIEEKMSYCVDLINYYGTHEFDPMFPEETGCGPYALGTLPQWIVDKTIAQKFMERHKIPEEYRQ